MIKKIVFLTLAAVRLCVCSGRELSFVAPLLAKELEHSEENMAALLRAFSRRAFRPNVLTGIFASIPD